jgi:hypothetical protein
VVALDENENVYLVRQYRYAIGRVTVEIPAGKLEIGENDTEAAAMFTHYNDDDATEPKEFTIDLSGFGCKAGTEIEVYLLDDTHDLTKQETLTYYGDRFGITLTVPNHTCYLFKLRKKD